MTIFSGNFNHKPNYSIQNGFERHQENLLDEIEKINSQATAQIEYSKKLDFDFKIIFLVFLIMITFIDFSKQWT